jgi:uncharacterized protein
MAPDAGGRAAREAESGGAPEGQAELGGEEALGRLVGFGRHLRASGLNVGTGRILTFCRATAVLAALDPFDAANLRAAARATLVSRPEDLPALDAAFDRYFGPGGPAAAGAGDGAGSAQGSAGGEGAAGAGQERPVESSASWDVARAGDEPEGEAAIRIVASAAEVTRTKDFAALSEDERRTAARAIRHLAFAAPTRRSRRYRAAARGDRFDLRGTLRRSMRTEGEPFRRAWKERRTRRRPLVLILDVSGSMAAYSRPLVEFAHVAAVAGRRVEVFCFGTRLTRVTRLLRRRDLAEALAAVGEQVTDWEGGTRIGESLASLLDEWSTRSALRGSVAILCSDGLERGDPAELSRQMARLSRLTHRLVWVNPLKGSPRYQPLARGMAASLPFVDLFLPGHNLASLESLAAVLSEA